MIDCTCFHMFRLSALSQVVSFACHDADCHYPLVFVYPSFVVGMSWETIKNWSINQATAKAAEGFTVTLIDFSQLGTVTSCILFRIVP